MKTWIYRPFKLALHHPFSFAIVEPRELVWTFNNIELPDSNINEAASHGFVKFTAKPRSTIPTGTVLANSASIFFDFNQPVITNTVVNQIGSETGDISVSPGSVNYGEIDILATSDRTITITNQDLIFSNLTHNSSSIIGVNANQFSILSGGGQVVLSPGQSHNVVVRFSPTSGGVKNAALRILSNDENEGTVDIALTGSGSLDGLARYYRESQLT